MRAALAALLLLAPVAAAALPAGPGPAGEAPLPAEVPLFLRADPDGGRTLTLLLEDDPAGPYAYTPLAAPGAGPWREVGTYLHAWTWQGRPEVTVGVYARDEAGVPLRVPRLVLEHAADEAALLQAAQDAVLRDAAGMLTSAGPFLLETLLPDLAEPSGADLQWDAFVDRPTVVAWQARRALPGAEAWLGTYLAREAAVHDAPQGREGARTVEVGQVLRTPDGDARLAGAYVEQRAREAADGAALATEVTAGARTPAGRVPLATVQGAHARFGAPGDGGQQSEVVLGAGAGEGFVPLLGVRTDRTERAHALGTEVVQRTAAGVYVDGAWTPLAGTRYRGERHALLDLPDAMLAGGVLGSNQSGDAELVAGAFVDGAWTPVAQVALDDAFAGQRHAHRTMLTVGAFSPLGYHPLASATYDGTDSLLDWALRVVEGRERGAAWLVAAGPWVGRLYSPVVGVRFRGDVPGVEHAREIEVAAGTFVVGYTAFVPLVAAGLASEDPWTEALLRMALLGPGHGGGPWQAGLGSYPVGDAHVPLVSLAYAPVDDPEAPAAADFVVRLAGEPALGVRYRGAAPLVPALGDPLTLADDQPWQAEVGAYAPGFVPLLTVRHDAASTTVLVGPGL